MSKHLLADVNVDDIVKKSLRKEAGFESPHPSTNRTRPEGGGTMPKGARTNCRECGSDDVVAKPPLDDGMVKCTCAECGHHWYVTSGVNESYVAEPKSYSQVSESVSQRTKEAHMAMYKDYIESLNRTSAELDTANRQDVNPRHSEYASLKHDETYNLNATWLHELYFANCFDPQSEVYMDSIAYIKIQRDFGNFDDWQKDFVACGLAAGEGWAVCGYNIFLKKYVNTVVKCHSDSVMLGLFPIVVVDMWSHSYFRDYLGDKKSYLISQMREINWNVVEQRVTRAESIAEVLK